MPTSADLLVDTSVAIRLLVATHEDHLSAVEAVESVGTGRLGLAGHAAFETYSVLTRLPEAIRVTGVDAASLIASEFPATHHLSARAALALPRRLAALAVVGGAIYDALVAAAAIEADRPLLTSDRRASGVYAAMGATVVFL